MRLRLSADIIDLYELKEGGRVTLGYDSAANAIAIKRSASPNDPTAATIDKRGYVSARPFFHRTRIEVTARRYVFASEQDSWLVFVASDS